MTWRTQNIESIRKLKGLGVDTGLAESIIKSNVNRNFTLDGELTACEMLLKSFNPADNKIRLLIQKNEEEEDDIIINELIFEVKRIVIPKVQRIIYGIAQDYIETVITEDRFIQVIVTLDEKTGLDTIKDGDLKIHKIKGITGVEILVDLNLFNELIAKKILRIYDKISNKNSKIPIIDVRYLEIADFEYIKSMIHRYYSRRGYFMLLLTYHGEDNKLIPMFFPIYSPEEQYQNVMEKLSNSITDSPIVHPYFYTCECKKEFQKGWNNLLQNDEGYLIIDGRRICKSLSSDKSILFYGAFSQSENLSKISFEENEKRTEMDVEYLNPT